MLVFALRLETLSGMYLLACLHQHTFSAKIHNIYYKAKKKDGKKMFASFLCVFSHKISVGQCKKNEMQMSASRHFLYSLSSFCQQRLSFLLKCSV